MLLVRRDSTLPGNPATHIVMQHRVDTRSWAIPGGARDYGESFRQAAIREASEEISLPLDCTEGANPLVVVRREATLTDHGQWKYVTLIGDVTGGFEPRRRPGDVESLSVEWAPIDQVGVRGGRFWPLLPAFWEVWSQLLDMVREMDGPVPANVVEQVPPRPVDDGSAATASGVEPPGQPGPTIVDNGGADDDDDDETLCYWFIPAMP